MTGNVQDIHGVTKTQHPHPTFGLLLPGVAFANEENVWLGARQAAKIADVNLLTIVGGHLKTSDNFLAQANVLYDLIQPKRLDGMVIFSSTVGWYLDPEGLAVFCKRYHPLPQVSMDAVIAGIPSILKDNYGGIRDVMSHLITGHGYRRIAFLCGPEKIMWAQERYRAYLETLTAYGLPVDPVLISPPLQGWDQEAAASLMECFIHERQLRPGQDFEAIVAATDNLARNAIKVLQARGLCVPQDVAVTGFDDEQESRVITPPLTTVPFPGYEIGQHGVEVLLSLWRGENVPAEVVVPAKLIVRQSCGCQSPVVLHADVETESHPEEFSRPPISCEAALTAQRDAIIAGMVDAIGGSDAERARRQAERLVEAFSAEMQRTSPGDFLIVLEDILQQNSADEVDVAVWQNAISILRRQMLHVLSSDVLLSRAENLWGKARVLIGEVAQRAQAYQAVLAEQRAQVLRELESALITTFEVQGLMDILAAGLPRLAMPGCYLAVYDNPKAPAAGARLILAYDRQGRRDVGDPGVRFPSSDLIPDAFFPQEQRFSLVLTSLYFREQQIGFVLFESGPREGKVYEVLRGQISSALQGALLVAEITRQKYILDTFMANVPDNIYFKDRESRFIRSNNALATSFGIKEPAELLGKTDFDFFPEEQARPKYDVEQEIIRTGQPRLALEEPDAQGRWALTTKMPLRDEHGTIIGTFGVSHDITPLKQAQSKLAAAYEEIKILNRQLQEENLRMSAELDVSRRIQQMVLPSTEELRQIEGLEIVGYMKPADEVGGDYYDVLEESGTIHIGIGDVTGHGLESGVLMLMTQTAIRTLIEHGETDPIAFLSTLNRILYRNIHRMNVEKTLTLMIVNYAQGTLKIVGQHEEVLLVRQGGHIDRVDTFNLGFPLGLEESIANFVEEVTIALSPGESVVLYTDGITEAENADAQVYGIDRLCAVISQHWDQPAEAIKQAVVDDVTRYIGQHKIYDDLTLVVLKQK